MIIMKIIIKSEYGVQFPVFDVLSQQKFKVNTVRHGISFNCNYAL